MRIFKLIIVLATFTVSAGAVYIPQPPEEMNEREMKCSRYREFVAEHGEIGATKAYHNYDVQKYTIDIYIDDLAEYITATTTVNIDIEENGVTQIELDLDDGSLTVNECRINGTPQSFTHAGELLTVNLGGSYNDGDNLNIAVDYEGSPSAGLIFNEDYGGRCYTFTEPNRSKYWFPCYNVPDDKADNGVELFINVRDDWDVASNGLLIGTTTPTSGRKEYHWLHEYPISMYLISFDATDMYYYEDTWDGIPLRIWSHSSQGDIEGIFDLYKLELDAFKYRCGDYPFADEKVGICDAGPGGMEHQTISDIGTLDRESLSAHEQAHQWWGNCVTCEDFDNLWLNEGFAKYCEMFYWEDAYGMDRVEQEMENDINPGEWWKTEPIYPSGYLGGPIYTKGSWVLHMMRNEMGSDTQFYDMLKYYRSQHEYGNANTQEFQSDVENFTGEDWNVFFQQWVYKAGFPEFEWYWTNSGPNEVTIHCEQVQDIIEYPLVPIFQIHIDFGLETAIGTEIHTVWMPDEEETFVINASAPVTDVELDPNVWLCCIETNLTAIEMVAFNAYPVRTGVKLEWETEEEYGGVSYNIYREEAGSTTELLNKKRARVNSEPIVGESPYSFVDKTAKTGITYDYWLEVLEPDSPVQTFGPATAEGPVLVKAFELMQNRPNPASGVTTFAFALPEATNAELSIYDIKGRKVDTIIESNLAAGEYEIDYACVLPSGIYVYRLDAGGETAIKKMVVK